MNRVLPFLFGPELYWLAVWLLTPVVTKRHLPPDPAVTSSLDQAWAVPPLLIVPLTFACFLIPGSSRWWLLLRIDLAIAVGLVLTTNRFCEAMTYHKPSAGPGVGTAWMVMLSLGYLLMLVGTAVAAIVIWWKGRTP